MITKAVVESIIGNKAVVRIPIIDKLAEAKGATKFKDLSTATICSLSNIGNPVSIGDVVYIGFEDHEAGRPIILGKLYTGTLSSDNPDINARIFNTTSTTKLYEDTYIGNVKPNEIGMLTGLQANVQQQFNIVNDNIKEINSDISDLNNVTLAIQEALGNVSGEITTFLTQADAQKYYLTVDNANKTYETIENVKALISSTNQWLPAVESINELPSTSNIDNYRTDFNYLCKVINEDAVYQLIAGTSEWELYSKIEGYVDESELNSSIEEAFAEADTIPSPSTANNLLPNIWQAINDLNSVSASDETVLHKTGNETISNGTKTFSGSSYVVFQGSAADRHLVTRGIGGLSVTGNQVDDLYVNYSTDFGLRFGKTGQGYLKADGSILITGLTDGTTSTTVSELVTIDKSQVISDTKNFIGTFQINGKDITYDSVSDTFIFGGWDDTGTEYYDTTNLILNPIDASGNITSENYAVAYMVGDNTDNVCNGLVQGDELARTRLGGSVNGVINQWTLTPGTNQITAISLVGISNLSPGLSSSTYNNAYMYISYKTTTFTSDASGVVTAGATTSKISRFRINDTTKTMTFYNTVNISYNLNDISIRNTSNYILVDPNGTYELCSEISYIEIINYENINYGDSLIIPTSYNGKPVTKISQHAFNTSEFTSITIPYTITTIGNYAFSNISTLQNLTVESNRLNLSANNFIFFSTGDATTLTVNFSGNVNKVAPFLFCPSMSMTYDNDFRVKTVNLNKVKIIGDGAFGMCFHLQNIDTKNVTEIGQVGFAANIALSNLDLNSVKSIGRSAFYLSDGLTSMYINKDATFVYDSTQPTFSATNLTIYTNATSKPDNWNEDMLNGVTIQYNVSHDEYLNNINSLSQISTVSLLSNNNDNNEIKWYNIK